MLYEIVVDVKLWKRLESLSQILDFNPEVSFKWTWNPA